MDCILVARDRNGQTIDAVTGRGALTAAQCERSLLPKLDSQALLVTDSHAAYRAFRTQAPHCTRGNEPARQRTRQATRQPRHPRAERERLPPAFQGLADGFLRGGVTLPAQLPGVALGPG